MTKSKAITGLNIHRIDNSGIDTQWMSEMVLRRAFKNPSKKDICKNSNQLLLEHRRSQRLCNRKMCSKNTGETPLGALGYGLYCTKKKGSKTVTLCSAIGSHGKQEGTR